MPINITMPALSPTMEEGTLARWLVKEGDRVEPGDVICEIETDKATMEVEAVDEGTIGRIIVADGTENVAVNAVIAILLEEGEEAGDISDADISSGGPGTREAANDKSEDKKDTPGAGPAENVPAKTPSNDSATGRAAPVAAGPAPVPASAEKSGSERVFSSPLARRMAGDAGIDISLIAGSGPKGRVIKADVEKALREGISPPRQAAAESPRALVSEGMGAEEVLALYEEGTYELRPNDGMRKVVAARLTEAKQTIPHFYLTIECQIDNLLAARAQINSSAPKDKEGKPRFKLSVNDFIMKAWALALQQVPDANATWAGDGILYHKASDVAVAVAVPGGLFTPVVRSAESKSLRQISGEVRDYAIRAKSKKLAPHEYQGGSSAVSNLGMFGIKHFSAVINPPHGTILAVGAGQEQVHVENGEIKTGTFMSVTLSCDHRAVDGALGAQLLGAFKALIENPVMMLA